MTYLRSFAGFLAVAGAAGLTLFLGDPAAADAPGDLTIGQHADPPAVSLSTPEVLEGTGGEGRTSPTTTSRPTTELDADLAASDESRGFDLRPVVAVAVAFGAIRLLRGWHLRRQT